LAIDFGSPQLFSLANVSVIPVSVSGIKLKKNIQKKVFNYFCSPTKCSCKYSKYPLPNISMGFTYIWNSWTFSFNFEKKTFK